jgi:hypothetical protein
MKRKGQGIRFQLTAGIVIMTIAGIGLIGIMSIKIVERSALVWKISQAEQTVGFVRASYRVSREGGQPWGAKFAEVLERRRGYQFQAYRLTEAAPHRAMPRDG